MADSVFGATDPLPRRAVDRAAPSSGDAQSAGDASRTQREGKEGSKGTLGPDGSLASETQPARQSASPHRLITNRRSEKTNAGGEDWFEVSLYLSYRNFPELSRLLDAAREAAENSLDGDELEFGGLKFLVRPSGASAGTAGKRIYFRWQLQCQNGLVIQLMNREQPHRTMPNGNVRTTSLLLMQLGAKRVWELALELLSAIGCIVERNKLSRVDACVDMPEMSIQSLCTPYTTGFYVSRARASRAFEYEDQFVSVDSAVYSSGRLRTGFVIGQGSLKLRVYDKFRESNHVLEKISAVVAYRWGYWTTVASRVEFSIRRDALKDVGVDTVADWFEKRAEICKYLCTSWFRLTTGEVDRNHADRSEASPEWLAVQQAFESWAGTAEYVALQPLATEECLPSTLLNQVIGLLVSYFARTGFRCSSNQHFFEVATGKLTKLVASRNLLSEIQRRALELGLMSSPFKEFENE